MRKNFTLSILFVAIIAMFSSCSAPNTPSGVAEKSMGYLKSENYDGFMTLVDLSKVDDAKEAEEFKTMYTEILRTANESEVTPKGGISSFKALEEEISSDGKTAKVEMETTYKDGTVDSETIKLVNVDGKWLLSVGK